MIILTAKGSLLPDQSILINITECFYNTIYFLIQLFMHAIK